MDNYLIRRGTSQSRENMMQWLQSGTGCPTATPSETPISVQVQVQQTTPTTASSSTTTHPVETHRHIQPTTRESQQGHHQGTTLQIL